MNQDSFENNYGRYTSRISQILSHPESNRFNLSSTSYKKTKRVFD